MKKRQNTKEDAVFSDELNHAYIIDGVRLSQKLLERGVFAIGFFFPLAAHGKARICT